MNCRYLLSGLSLPFTAPETDALALAADRLRSAGADPKKGTLSVWRKSTDARKKNDIRFVYGVAFETDTPLAEKTVARLSLSRLPSEYVWPTPEKKRPATPPIVVGTGPCGLFCALYLARAGYAPVLLERGDEVKVRVAKKERFLREGILDTESNVQFGAGGAGTFSDGKLVTRIGDSRVGAVLAAFRDFGAPDDVVTNAKPHVGTDVLVTVVSNVLSEIVRLGGKVLYRTRLDDIRTEKDGVVLVTNAGEFFTRQAVLAVGHSARDTYGMLLRRGFAVEPKPFSVGVRIEHLQSEIDRALYGDSAGHPLLPHGEYQLSDTTGDRGVYTFCMCPGGTVIAAASEEGGVVVNGMSTRARDGKNADSAVAVSVLPSDTDGTPMGAIGYQRSIERAAFAAGGRNYRAPAMTVGDFLDGKSGTEPTKVFPTYRDGAVTLCDLRTVLPSPITENLARGIRSFGRKLPGFDSPYAMLTGVETRTSAPVRLLRTEKYTSLTNPYVYPCGEGAGYAGGITSAAADGLRVAEEIVRLCVGKE